MVGSTFTSVESFYAADDRRRRSPELDFGVWWRLRRLVYRLTWLDATGELVAVQLTPPRVTPFTMPAGELGELMLGGLGVAIIGGEAGAVTVLGVVEGRDGVERVLEGWAEVCGGPDSLEWVLDRVHDAGPPA
jgi:hypothetical protein